MHKRTRYKQRRKTLQIRFSNTMLRQAQQNTRESEGRVQQANLLNHPPIKAKRPTVKRNSIQAIT